MPSSPLCCHIQSLQLLAHPLSLLLQTLTLLLQAPQLLLQVHGQTGQQWLMRWGVMSILGKRMLKKLKSTFPRHKQSDLWTTQTQPADSTCHTFTSSPSSQSNSGLLLTMSYCTVQNPDHRASLNFELNIPFCSPNPKILPKSPHNHICPYTLTPAALTTHQLMRQRVVPALQDSPSHICAAHTLTPTALTTHQLMRQQVMLAFQESQHVLPWQLVLWQIEPRL